MQIPTHILAGWVIGNSLKVDRRTRLLTMVAAEIADIDGITLLFFGWESYRKYHHIVGHNVFFIVLTVVILAVATAREHRTKAIALYIIALVSHLILDSFGSGYTWGLALLWPASDRVWMNPYVWDFRGWQNSLALILVSIATLVIFIRHKRTPLEAIFPRIDTWLVNRYSGKDRRERPNSL